jgi:plasmid stabilization system protein ParE
MPVSFHPAAEAELLGARDWYEQARAGLGSAFADEIERIITLIEERPHRFPFHTDAIRRASLRRFPFSLYFEEIADSHYIWAVFHHRRDPAILERRHRGQ